VEQEAIGARRVRALLATKDLDGARRVLDALLHEPSGPSAAPGAPRVPRMASSPAVPAARLERARATDDPLALGQALEDLARSSADDARARSEMLVEAAQAAARAGDTDASLARAKDAARLAPDVAATQLFARGLEYRLRGAGSPDDAKATISALARLATDPTLEPEDIALRAFLLAEAEDVITPGTGEKTLRDCLTAVGPQALVTLGLAERAMAGGRAEEAVRFFGDAVYGNLLGLRRPGQVALAAVDAAERAADGEAVLRFVDQAAKDPESRAEALRRLEQSALPGVEVARARTSLRKLAESLEPADRAEVLARLARLLFDSSVAAERLEADRTLREAIETAPGQLAERFRAQLGGFRSRPPPISSNPPSPPRKTGPPQAIAVIEQEGEQEAEGESSSPPTMQARTSVTEMLASVRHPPLGETAPLTPAVPTAPSSYEAHAEARRIDTAPELVAQAAAAAPVAAAAAPPAPPVPVPGAAPSEASRTETTAVSQTSRSDPFLARVVDARKKIAAGDREQGEKILAEALREGSLAAADELDRLYVDEPARSASLLKVRRQAVELQPGDMSRLVSLRDAARIDKNPNYVRAIEHVLRAFDPNERPLAPPPLSAQQTQPGMLTLLTRHSREIAGESFGIVWASASGLFAKPTTAYRMTGLERVAPGPMWTLSRLYEVALRLLDTPRFPLFHRRGAGPLTLTVALLQHPSAILAGEAREDGPDLRWMLGHALASVLPENALPLGLPESEARNLWDVLLGSFGPPARTKMDRTHANLAEMLWQTLSPRAQRRLKELLGHDDTTPFELVVERANQSGRRVGMFLTGDFAHAARTIVSEHAALDVEDLNRPGGLARLCAALPSLADLFRLAVRPEYADARWHVPAPQSQRFPAAGGLPPV
jgi:tetratricopeptide (TPR) repeat protein